MDLYFQGLARLNKGWTPDSVAQARSLFDRALSADPDNVDALIGSARADARAGAFLYSTDPITAFAAAEAKLAKALSSVPDYARAHLYMGIVDIYTKRAAKGIVWISLGCAASERARPGATFAAAVRRRRRRGRGRRRRRGDGVAHGRAVMAHPSHRRQGARAARAAKRRLGPHRPRLSMGSFTPRVPDTARRSSPLIWCPTKLRSSAAR